MKLITKDTDYAIRALCYIAKQKNRLVSAGELKKKLKIPYPFLRKILQKLNKMKLLKSYKGKGGGFRLAKPTDRIIIADLIKIFQGPIKLMEHVFKEALCPNVKNCALKKKLDVIEKHLISQLKRIKVSSLI